MMMLQDLMMLMVIMMMVIAMVSLTSESFMAMLWDLILMMYDHHDNSDVLNIDDNSDVFTIKQVSW